MLLLGVLLAASTVTVLAVLMSSLTQARNSRSSAPDTLLAGERERFDEIVAPLEADPEFGRIDR